MEQLKKDLETDDWTTVYAQYFMQYIAPQRQFNPAQQTRVIQLIQNLFKASQLGDSMLACTAQDVADLSPIVQTADSNINVIAPVVFSAGSVALYRYWQLEQRLSEQVVRLTRQTVTRIDPTIAYTLLRDPYQRQALDCVSQQALSIITGGPGTGKTYTLARIIALLQHALPQLRIAMAAPTGKAAQRMQEALQHALAEPELQATGWISPALVQQRTQTLHRLLGIGTQQKPRFNALQPLPYDVIVVDEASMLDLSLATALFEAVPPQARLILLGDAQQLASVDVGAVLADLQACDWLKAHRVHLQHSRRFHADAAIGRCAAFIQRVAQMVSATATSPTPSSSATSTNTPTLTQNTMPLTQQFYAQVAAPTVLHEMRDLSPDEMDRVQCCQLPLQATAELGMYYQHLMLGYMPYVKALQNYMQQTNDALASSVATQQNEADRLQAVVDAFDDYRLLSGVKHGAWGVRQLNRVAALWIQQQLLQQPDAQFYVGRAVMMTYNDYALGLSNGDIGICLPRRDASPKQRRTASLGADAYDVYFPSLQQWFAAQRLPKTLQDAFALTIHKSQGSEFRHCAVLLSQDAENLLSRELLYTAISRAKRVVSLWHHPSALQQALQQDSSRHSALLPKLNQMLAL